MAAIPIKPAAPTSFHTKHATIIESNGPIHNAFIPMNKYSNRLTSLDSKLTTLPGAVAPSAV